MPKNFQLLNLEMAKQVVELLVSRGAISGEEDGLENLADANWVRVQGYEHVSRVLTGEIGQQACKLVFERMRQSE